METIIRENIKNKKIKEVERNLGEINQQIKQLEKKRGELMQEYTQLLEINKPLDRGGVDLLSPQEIKHREHLHKH